MRKILTVMALMLLIPLSTFAVELELDKKSFFEANFTVDSVHTEDGNNYKLSASGDAGPYGRVYLSYIITNKQNVPGQGEFTGWAWSQVGEETVTATLQGISKKEGSVYKMYTLDLVSNGKTNFAIGTLDMVAKTMKFEVAEF